MNEQTNLYNPYLTSSEKRQYISVSREVLVNDALGKLKASLPKQSKPHFLYIGVRGVGKSHLLSLVQDGIEADSALRESLFVVRFPEEANRILSFADFLLGLIERLADVFPDESLWPQLYEEFSEEENDTRIIDGIVPHIRKSNRENGRSLLIMLENLNEILGRQIKNKSDIGAMRKFFMDHNGCSFMATSPIHFEGIQSVDEPFYDFFNVLILRNLKEEESIDLVKRNLTWDKHTELLEQFAELEPKLRALYRMTAGNPRLTTMLYKLIADDNITEVKAQLHRLLDQVTPFYQDRINDLAPQERALLELMSTMRNSKKSPALVASKLRIGESQTRTLLNRLHKGGYIRKHHDELDKRKAYYTISEGFFDIWLAMRTSRAISKRIPFLLDFFAMFYPSLAERQAKREDLKKMGNLDMLDALSEVGEKEEKAKSKIELAAMYRGDGDEYQAQGYLEEVRSLGLDSVGQWITDRSIENINYLDEIEDMIECWDTYRSGDLENFVVALSSLAGGLNYKNFSELKLKFCQDHLKLVTDENKRINLTLEIAYFLKEMARWNEALPLLENLEKELSEDHDSYSVVANDLAQLLKETNRLAEAEPLMKRALAIDEARYGKEHPTVAIYLNNLALLLLDTNRLEDAEPLMKRALAIDESSYGKEHPAVAIRLNNMAQLLQDTNRLAEAEPLMKRALAIDESNYGKEHPTVAIRLNNLAQLLKATNRLAEAEPLMKRALAIDESSYGKEHPNVARDLNNLALLFQDTNRLAEAEPLMKKSLSIFERFKETTGFEHPSYEVVKSNLLLLQEELEKE